MSHITLKEAETRDQQVTDLAAFERACKRCGLEFRRGQTTYRTWKTHAGRLVGDWPLPQGYTADEIGTCEHAAAIPGDAAAYEIGLVPSRKYPGTYSLIYDFFGGRIDAVAGKGLSKLQMYYQMESARSAAAARGDVYKEIPLPNGAYRVEVDTTLRMGA